MSLDDLVFEHRNQAFGAFFLRRQYANHILKGLILALAIFTAFVGIPYAWQIWKPATPEAETELVTVDPRMVEPPPIDPKTPPPPPLPASPPPPKVTTVRFVPPEVVPDEEVTEDPPKQEELKQAQAGTETVVGDPTADPNELQMDQAGSGEGAVIGAPEETDEPFLLVDQMPQFPEGDLQTYFAKHLKYPQRALLAEVTGRVYISFVVMPDGSVADVTLLKGLGYGCDEEALRVVKAMPTWQPGKNGGRAVKVRINVPIHFKM